MKNKYFALLFSVMMICTPLQVLAVDAIDINIESIYEDDQQVFVSFNTNYQGSLDELVSQIDGELNGIPVEINELSEYNYTDEGTTWMFLVDVSESISAQRLEQTKEILLGIGKDMSPNDNAIIVTIGNEVKMNSFVSDFDEFSQQVNDLERILEKTNLYAGIVQSLELLETDSNVNLKKCLVVMSDGEDFHLEGYTQAEVERKIEAANIPVHIVAMAGSAQNATTIEQTKILNSFARTSPGGIDISLGLGQDDATNATEKIKEAVGNAYLLSFSVPEGTAIGQQRLALTLKIDDVGTASDEANISITSSSIVVEEPEPEEVLPPEKESIGIASIVMIIVPLLLVVVIVVVLVKKKNAKILAEKSKEVKKNKEKVSPAIIRANLAIAKNTFRFIKMGMNEQGDFSCDMEEELIIGRSTEVNLVFAEDELLSSKHCRIFKNDEYFMLEDLGSTNGTYLNGVPVTKPIQIQPDDILLIGAMELRIVF